MRLLVALLILVLTPLALAAQEDDRGFLTGLIEDNLSGAGRQVRIEGFAGALSSRATFSEMTIADAQGVWLTIRDGAISWNRSALLSGRIEVEEMTAAEILLPRKPVSDGPAPEAQGFSLPELPVSVKIGTLRAERVALGEPILGRRVVARLEGSMQLGGGEGETRLVVERIDGETGRLALNASYANETRRAMIDLLLREGAGGIVSTTLGLPGAPALELALHGTGPTDDFRADLSLSSDNQPRLAGTITLRGQEDEKGRHAQAFAASLSGDIAPLFLPDYRDFFGNEITLEAEGKREDTGRFELSRLVLDSRGIDVTGSLALAPGGAPERAVLTLRMGRPEGGEILLPISGPRTWLKGADLVVRYAARRDDGWSLQGEMLGLRRPEIAIDEIRLAGSGRIAPAGTEGVRLTRMGGTIRFAATGVAPTDPALARALGQAVAGKAVFHWLKGTPLRIPVIEITGDGLSAAGGVSIAATETGPELSGRIAADLADMARLSGIAGRELGGAAKVSLQGRTAVLAGSFDATARVEGRDLTIGIPEADRLLAGQSVIETDMSRDETGITVKALDVVAGSLAMQGSGVIRTGASDLTARMEFSDLSVLGPQYGGAMQVSARLTETGAKRRITLNGQAQDLAAGRQAIDKLLRGRTELDIAVLQEGRVIWPERLDVTNPQIRLQAAGRGEGDQRSLDLSARLSDLALFAPGFPGPVTAEGRVAALPGDGYDVDIAATGPGGTDARISGTVAEDGSTADLAIAGGAQSAMLNPFIQPRNIEGPLSFDLRLSGAPSLSALTGRVALNDARLVAPLFGIELRQLSATADLADAQARIAGNAKVRGGGEVAITGPIALTSPFVGDLTISLRDARLADPDLYETTVTGDVSITGPFRGGASIGGQVRLGRTEILIASAGVATDPVLRGIAHVSEPPEVRQTRRRARLIRDNGEERNRVSYGLDLAISAPDRIFVRGRGLDAELGGSLRVSGTTADIVPSGQFNLIRGRLDLLGKRFTIDEGLVQLQGALEPWIRFAATTQTDEITATILIEGPASSPEISFLSSPELPEEEVVSQILFGRGLTNLSPLQAAQLASAVAELAGRGGGGIVARLRESVGLDDLDITTAQDGSASVRAGKYLTDRVYSDVSVGSDGKAEINLNLDVRPGVKMRGRLDSEGNTGIGVFWERDY
ncbi:translocation and assembly module TamB [Albidovulum inexpectatum]|uniref:Translocation and assembly module TamB n=1 Tax=Albidovulum inexpectatum TaxID=196587 RepID=A0A2S5JN57_9RHOB|nr:translocation/assembly module TamB domain-containing protein [Albidovulum inexpectatum]PPB82675.1 translocation and assembly module TamB [Albidovulum inexpectatum]